jgi:hypothetical protein
MRQVETLSLHDVLAPATISVFKCNKERAQLLLAVIGECSELFNVQLLRQTSTRFSYQNVQSPCLIRNTCANGH